MREQRDTEAAKSFFRPFLGAHDMPEIIHTDKLLSDGAAIRELGVLYHVEYVGVTSTARCSNLVEHSDCGARQQPRNQLGFRQRH